MVVEADKTLRQSLLVLNALVVNSCALFVQFNVSKVGTQLRAAYEREKIRNVHSLYTGRDLFKV